MMRQQHQGMDWNWLEQQLFLPAESVPETLESQLVRPGPTGIWLFWIAVAGVFGLLLWAAFAHIEVVVRCRGMLRPHIPVHVLRSPVEGIVEELRVQLHQVVRQGDTLVRFRDSEVQVRLRTLEQELAYEQLNAEELQQLLQQLPTGGSPAELLGQLPQRTWRSPMVQALAQLIRKDVQLFARQQELLRRRWERTAALYERQFASGEEYEEALAAVRELELRTMQYLQSRRQELVQRLDAAEHRLQELRTQQRLLREQLRSYVLTAPVDGQITELRIPGVGAYCTAGQELLTLTPEAQLEAELLVEPADILLVRSGQPVRYLLQGYPAGQWERLEGEVLSVAENVGATGTGQPVYIVRASLRSEQVRERGSGVLLRLQKGLPVQAAIVVGRKPLLQWLYDRSRSIAESVVP
jgi:multidrug resistance efflux pump